MPTLPSLRSPTHRLPESYTGISEPVAVRPVVAEPIVVEPVVAEPVVAKPVAAKPIVKSLQEVRSEQIQKATAEQQRQLQVQKTAQLSKARREGSGITKRKDLPGYGAAFEGKVKEQMEGVEKSIGEAFEAKEKEIKIAAKKALRKLGVTGEVVALPDGEYVNKEWFDELSQEEKDCLLEQGLGKYRQEYLVQLEPETYVNKKWYNTLTTSEQKDLRELGLAKWQETFYEVVGPDKELIPKSVLQGLVTPEFGKWLAYQEFQATDYSSLESKRLLGQQIATSLQSALPQSDDALAMHGQEGDPYRFLKFDDTVKRVMDDPEQMEAFGTFIMATRAPDLLKTRVLVEKYTPSELEGFLKDYNDVAKTLVDTYMQDMRIVFRPRAGNQWASGTSAAQNIISKWLDKINPNYTEAKNTEYASKMIELGLKQYSGWFDEMMAGHGQTKTILGEYVDRNVYEGWAASEKGSEGISGAMGNFPPVVPMETFVTLGRWDTALKTVADNLGVNAAYAVGNFMSSMHVGNEPSQSAMVEIRKYPGLEEAFQDYLRQPIRETAQRILNIVRENSKLPTPTIPELPASVATPEQVESIPLVKSEKDWGVSREVSSTRKPTKYGNLGRGNLPSATPSIVKGR